MSLGKEAFENIVAAKTLASNLPHSAERTAIISLLSGAEYAVDTLVTERNNMHRVVRQFQADLGNALETEGVA